MLQMPCSEPWLSSLCEILTAPFSADRLKALTAGVGLWGAAVEVACSCPKELASMSARASGEAPKFMAVAPSFWAF